MAQNQEISTELIQTEPELELNSNNDGDNTKNSENKIEPTSAPSDKERELLDMLFQVENEKQTLIDESRKRISQLRKDLEDSLLENEKLKQKTVQLEQTLRQSVALSGGNPIKSKADQEELLTRAKTLLFEKTKTCKQQEQQIDVLKAQVESIKEVLNVTKDMLNLKIAEGEHMETRLETAHLRAKAENDKSELFQKKLAISKSVYTNLKAEFDTQKKIFMQLKEAYEAKINVLSTALAKSKEK